MVNGCTAGNSNAEQEVRATLFKFLAAFENGDIEFMEEFFADDALTFPRVIMSNEHDTGIRTSDYERVMGIDPQMRMAVREWREKLPGPPYITLQPEDLNIKMYSDVALVTFHLKHDNALSRRTFVLVYQDGSWKIVHLHASNVLGSD
jgi:ketosteroid isomerase-like protein